MWLDDSCGFGKSLHVILVPVLDLGGGLDGSMTNHRFNFDDV